MKFPWQKPDYGPLTVQRGEFEELKAYIENNVVELGRLRDIRDNRQNELWPPTIWKLISLADTFVLGRKGIYPRFNDPEATNAWKRHRVDSAGLYSPREFLRVILSMMVVNNEVFLRIDSGTLTPMPPPLRINYEKNIPVSYMWSSPQPMILPAEEVWHLLVRWYPGQKRGDPVLWVLWDLLNDRRNYLKSLIKMAKNAARMSLFHRRNRGNPLLDSDSTEEDVKGQKQTFSFDEDTMLQIGPNDNIESVQAAGPSVAPSEIDRLVMGTVGQRAGLSRMTVAGDFSEATYSSARFADLSDQGVWQRYQDLLEEVVEWLYMQWELRPFYEQYFQDIHIPPHPYIDPERTVSVNRQLLEIGAKSVQEIIRETGEDPETVFAEIEEYKRRFPQEMQMNPNQNGPTVEME